MFCNFHVFFLRFVSIFLATINIIRSTHTLNQAELRRKYIEGIFRMSYDSDHQDDQRGLFLIFF